MPPIAGDPSNNPSQPFDPDLIAAFDYARFARPVVPDSINPATATAEQLLSFLGDHATPPPRVAGDMDLDGDVDGEDAALFAGAFGTTTGALWTDGDFDGDGAATLADLARLQANLGGGAMSMSARHAVPEPSATALVAAGICVGVAARLSRRFRRRERVR